MKRLVIVALATFSVLHFLEDLASPVFAPLFRGIGEVTFAVIGFAHEVDFRPNLDPASRETFDTDVVILREDQNEIGMLCDSGTLEFTVLAVFFALWLATPLGERKLVALRWGLILSYLYIVARIGLMVLQVVATHECASPASHWGVLRREELGSLLTFVNRELATDVVIALFGPFVIWALVCGRAFLFESKPMPAAAS